MVVPGLIIQSGAFAQAVDEDELALVYGDKSNITIATGSRQDVVRAPSTATVITAQDIQAMGATDLDQVLESVPGLHVSQNHVAGNPIYVFRGIAPLINPQVLVLVNGIPITNVFWGDRGQIWGGFPLEQVARIEVIRGPGSALYGADAVSGVINIHTKGTADVSGTQGGLRLGSYNSQDAWVQHGSKLGVFDSAFYLRAGKTDGSRGLIQQDAQSGLDMLQHTQASLAPGSLSTSNKAIDARAELAYDALRLRASYQKRELGVGGGVAGSLDPNSRGHSSRFYVDASYERMNWLPDWDVSALVGYFSNREWGNPAYMLFPPGAVLPSGSTFHGGMIGNPGHAERHTQLSASAFYTGFEQHRLRLGTGYTLDDMYEASESKNYDAVFAPLPMVVDATGNPSLVYMLPHQRHLTYLFVQDEWSLRKDWTLTAGVRHDRYSDFGSTTNPRLALVWDAEYNLVVKLMHGSAFRAPSFSEQYAINNPVTIGNPAIKPETMVSDELGVVWQTNQLWQNSLNVFRYRLRDIILPTGASYQNSGDQTGQGFELESTLDISRNVRLSGSLSVQHSRDETTGLDAGIAPHRRFFVRADWRFLPLWQLGVTTNHVADRAREPGDLRPQIPDYTMVDVALRREKVVKGLDVSARVSNLFNQSAWEPSYKAVGMYSDFPLAGRAFYVQLQLAL